MPHKKRKGKRDAQRGSGVRGQPVSRHEKKGRFSTGMKMMLAALIFMVIGGVAYWQLGSSQQQYPQGVAGIFYANPTITEGGTKMSLPYSFVEKNKLIFIDLTLEKQTNELTYQGRTIPLRLYKGGKYLPLVIISTPSGKVISGIRVCEPCGSFSFHIVQGKYLDCDACGTRWDIETLKGISGACPNYPPPKLTSSVGDNIEIDLSPLGIKVTS